MSRYTRKAENQRDLLLELVKTRFKLRYNNSFLGFLWVLMKPLLYFLILYFIFTAFRSGAHDKTYAVNLLLGVIMYTFFQEGVTFGMNSLLDMASIILKIDFPRRLAVFSSIIMALINLGINMLVLFVIATFLGFFPTLIGFIYTIIIMAILLLMIFTISQYLSVLLVHIRDLTNIMDLFFQLLFWASAVFYGINDIEGTTGNLIRSNPIAILIDAARSAFIHSQFTHLNEIVIITTITLIMFFLGNYFFNRNIKKISEYF